MLCPACSIDISTIIEAQIALRRSELARKAGLARSGSMTKAQRVALAQRAGSAPRGLKRTKP